MGTGTVIVTIQEQESGDVYGCGYSDGYGYMYCGSRATVLIINVPNMVTMPFTGIEIVLMTVTVTATASVMVTRI